MFNPGAMTLSELGAIARDLSIVGVVLSLGWKARSLIQPVIDVFNDAKTFFSDAKTFLPEARMHMTTMQGQMNTLLTNHLSHLKQHDEVVPAATQAKQNAEK